MQPQNSLPSIDKPTASDINDPSRLPSYRETRRYRFYPYERSIPVLVNEEDLLVGFPIIIFPCRCWVYSLFRTQFMMMNASYWTFLPCLFVASLRLSSSILTTTWYSNQTLIEPTSAPSYWRVWWASSPKYGTCHCIWITRRTPFHSHCGPSYLFFLPYCPDLVIRSLLLALHAQIVDKNFVHTEPSTL